MTVLNAINEIFFVEEQFQGNRAAYMNPENSFFNRVLDDHIGIPITLSLLYMEVARRVGIQIDGIGLPYHFMVRCCLPDRIVYIDPFEEGLFFTQQGAANLLRKCRAQYESEKQIPCVLVCTCYRASVSSTHAE